MSALSPSQQPTVLFSIYQNNTWTIRCLVDETIDPATLRIILKIIGFQILVCPVGESQQKTDPLEKDFASTGKYVYYFQTYSFLCLPIHSSILFAKLCLGKQNITEYSLGKIFLIEYLDKKGPKGN